jgi:kynurenine formamidase
MAARFIDLTHSLYDGSPSWPGDPGISVTPHCLYERDGCRVARVSLGTHQGTHVDAPSHFLKEGGGMETMDPGCFFGPARCLRIPKEGQGWIGVEDFVPFDVYVKKGARLVVHTGWDAHWGRDDFCLGGPSLTLEAAQFLASRGIALLGVDMATPSVAQPKEVHEALLGAGVTIVENLSNLGGCPDEFVLAAFPLLLEGLDGSPVRAVAIV